MTGFPDFSSYCDRCLHKKVCEYLGKFADIDDELQDLISEIKNQREIETGEDVNFYGLICLPQPCPYFHEKTSKKESVEQ